MKKKFLMFSALILLFVFTLFPISTLTANPGNFIKNGDFSDNLNGWQSIGTVNIISEEANLGTGGSFIISQISQNVNICDEDAILGFDLKPIHSGPGPFSVGINIFNNNVNIGAAWYFYHVLPADPWASYSFKLSDLWNDYHGTSMPNFDKVLIFAETTYGLFVFDNFSLEGDPCPDKEPEVWVRTMPMTCWQV